MDIIVVESDTSTNSAGGIGHDVSVAEHGTFGVARSSASEADGGEHVGLGRADGARTCFAGGFNFVEGHNGEVRVCLFDGFINGSHHDDVLERAADYAESDRQLGGAYHNGGEAGVLDDVLHCVVSEGVVQGDSADGLAVGSLLRKHPLSAILRKEANHAVARNLIEVFDTFVARAHKAPVDKTFADVHRSRVSVTVVDPHVRTAVAGTATGSCVASSQAAASAAINVGAMLEVVIEGAKTWGDGINKPFSSVLVAIGRAAGSGGLEVFGGDGVADLRS